MNEFKIIIEIDSVSKNLATAFAEIKKELKNTKMDIDTITIIPERGEGEAFFEFDKGRDGKWND